MAAIAASAKSSMLNAGSSTPIIRNAGDRNQHAQQREYAERFPRRSISLYPSCIRSYHFVPLGNLRWVTKTPPAAALLRCPRRSANFTKRRLCSGRVTSFRNPWRSAAGQVVRFRGWQNLDRTAGQCDHSKLMAGCDDLCRIRHPVHRSGDRRAFRVSVRRSY